MMHLLSTMYLIALMGLAAHRMHLLSALLCLEGLMLVTYIAMSLCPNYLILAAYVFPIFLLSMSACEAALGLALMVATYRSQGDDNLMTLNLLQC
uniref:NADH-ubiquinone oxidoreductase chain 4L n=1 Tax=Polypedates braueri TaxID=1198049 RepID=A0A140DEE1_POLBR|nr:NADH dehydrogenase subunit 4L [Polypedates braueri]AMK46138.1 NADH dehydrogenase subunit 4L [Polypedates braueri]QCI03848.1 NADH dehydrogenase subunit 4L [Polypedates braueri]UKT59899.1 NADH dehydrogenase subunit 4L [Polypedates braueri]